ncbi:cysteine synthase A, O-acetylserine sulfhydrolase A subunit [Candidatus Sulfobium mesophilum]|uniref:Cysteine synthase n=1 Tax=Candidatus Sulfobium mesophilum TaxID=2016548 RepID=A0A2U3QIM2_9BACT|nr:cysteine synthase A, O-acetylserine sulfhydrolase A subunit [Candidatus Sulfobium mesophilum]
MKLHEDILKLIGNTPLVRVNRMTAPEDAEIWAKLEGYNPGGSVKDRIALSMIESAEKEGKLRAGGTIIEPTSGNTGIGLAMVAAIKGYKLVLTMPDTMSMERRQLLQAYGAELVLTEGKKGMKGAVEKAVEIHQSNPGYYFIPQQFENPANPEVHRKTTALEIISDLGSAPDGFVAGIGTGGTITGVGEVLKDRNSAIWIAAVEPAASPVLSGGSPGPHKIAGIGAGFVPGVLNTNIYNEVITVTDTDAAETAQVLAKKEGILPGISSGAAMWAAIRVARRLGKGKRVAVILPDRGERYLSTGLFVSESP